MMRMFLCGAMVLGSAGIVVAQSGPLSVSFPDHEIVRIDTGYQTATPIAPVPDHVAAIEYSSDGFVYGVDWMTDTLIRIDPLTGAVQTVGPLGIDLLGAADLDEDVVGQLWMLPCNSGELYRIDTATGAATLECQTPTIELCGLATLDGTRWTTTLLSEPPADPGCGFSILQAGTVSTSSYLDAAADGWIYSIHHTVTPGEIQYSTVSRLNPATGADVLLGTFTYHTLGGGLFLNGITLDPDGQPSIGVPAMGWPGVAALTLFLLATGCWFLQRRS